MALSIPPSSQRISGLRRPDLKRNGVSEDRRNNPSQDSSFCHWDTQSTCIPMFPAFRYISRKLAQRKLYIALIVTDYGQCIMPAWPIPRSSQTVLTKVVRKACEKFHFGSSWMTALGATSGKRGSIDFFDINRFDPYLIHRSLIQNEVIFGGDGLTLLSVDHIYTFKHFLGVLSSISWVPLSRMACLASCIELLRRINIVYTGRKPLQGYFLRVYTEVKINQATLEEVCAAYTSKYGKTENLEIKREAENGEDFSQKTSIRNTQSPTIAVQHDLGPELDGIPINYTLPKFISDIDSRLSSPWGSDTYYLEERFPIVTYPRIKGLSGVPNSSPQTPPTPNSLHTRNALCSQCRANITSTRSLDAPKDTTTILGSEWESFREIGLGLYTE